MRVYLDSSVALYALLPNQACHRVREWLDQYRDDKGQLFSSTLLELELVRILRRERIAVTRARPILDRLTLMSIDDSVLRVAASIEPHIKSLDAIHLASCLMLGSGLILATHDAQMTTVAAQLGIETLDPLA